MKLSILIPTTPDRRDFIYKLHEQFIEQLRTSIITRSLFISEDNNTEILIFEDDKTLSIGHKRNVLLSEAIGDYVAFIDSDDRISDNYFKLLFEGINKGVDCCSLKGIITENGANPLIFEHSIMYNAYRAVPVTDSSTNVTYERYPNHLNCIKASIAKQFRFPETNHGEDTDWATQIHRSGFIKTEHYIPEILYYYDWIQK